MITLAHTTNLELPKSVRTYIDKYACEFGETDAWMKIAHIAYRIKRGANLLPDFIVDIRNHMEHPAYGNYEYTAKRSIAHYIEMLRTDDKQDISAIILPDNMSFPALFQLLTEEILYRYWEDNIDNDKVECHFDKAYYNYEDIASRFPKTAKASRHFIKYLSTSKETLRNIEVDERSIRLKNGWSLLDNKMYGYTLWSDKEEDERIYPGDAPFIHAFNEKASPLHQFIVGVPPTPFSGNLLNAKVIILTLNPGYVEEVNKTKCMNMRAAEKEQLLYLMRQALSLNGTGIYDGYECSRIQGDYYWEKSFAKLAMEAYGSPSTEKLHPIYEDIAFLQLIGYHSVKFKSVAALKHMPSAIFNNMLVKYLATKTKKTFLVLRSETQWKEVFGEELWSKLEAEGRIITKGHKGMSQAISRGNLKKDNSFDKLIHILKQ